MNEEEFKIEAEKALFRRSPWLKAGVDYYVKVKEFNETLDALDRDIMAIEADVDEKTKRAVTDEMKAKLVKFVSEHNKNE